MKAQSNSIPAGIQDLGDGTYLENTNITELTRIDELTGEKVKYYEYDSIKKERLKVPEKIAAYRLRSWAELAGLNEDIESFFASLPGEGESTFALNAWRYGTDILRNSTILNAYIDQNPHLTHEQVDQIFIDLYSLPL